VTKPDLTAAGWSFSQTSCVTRYNAPHPFICYKRAGEKSRPESCAISALANDEFAVKPRSENEQADFEPTTRRHAAPAATVRAFMGCLKQAHRTNNRIGYFVSL